MKQVIEFIPTALFAIVYLLSSQVWDTGKPLHYAAIALTAGYALQIILTWALWRIVEKLHLGIFALLVVSVSLTIFFNDSAFLIWKFTVVYWLFGAAILVAYYAKGLNLTQHSLSAILMKFPDIQFQVPQTAWQKANSGVTLFFFSVGALNLYIGYVFSESTWVMFKVVGSLILSLIGLAVLMSYLMTFKVDEPLDEIADDEAAGEEE